MLQKTEKSVLKVVKHKNALFTVAVYMDAKILGKWQVMHDALSEIKVSSGHSLPDEASVCGPAELVRDSSSSLAQWIVLCFEDIKLRVLRMTPEQLGIRVRSTRVARNG